MALSPDKQQRYHHVQPDYSIPVGGAQQYMAATPGQVPVSNMQHPQFAQQGPPGYYATGAPLSGGPVYSVQPHYVQPPPGQQYVAQPPVQPMFGFGGAPGFQPTMYDEEAGGYKPAGMQEGAYVSEAESMIRKGFIRKVYSILLVQILATIGMACLFMFNTEANDWVLSSPNVFIGAIVLTFILLFATICNRRKYPLNVGLLALWTIVEAFTVGVLCAAYARQGAGEIVLQAFIITGVIFLGLTVFTLQSKIDMSPMGSFLGMGLLALIAWGIIVSILGWRISWVFALLGALLFSAFIVYDTWLLANAMDPDDYVLAAISLYLDILNLFMCILRLLGSNRD